MGKISIIFIISLFFVCNTSYSIEKTNVAINTEVIIKKNVRKGVSSTNLCWLLDSDLNRPNSNRSMKSAIKDMGAGSLRFPYGHLADNYLWDVNLGKGEKLLPKIAADSTQPANWEWAVNSDGGFKRAMDFDEYMKLCDDLDIVPLVVVNALSYKYKNGPTVEELIESAKAWVQYAKSKNYKVGYWQIGNEVDHHGKIISKREYVDVYKKIAKAMKGVDQSIKVGPGILSKVDYFNLIIEEAPELIDFTSCHQYMWAHKDSCATYEDWLNIKRTFIPNVKKMQNAVRSSGKNMDIVITETGITGSGLKYNNVFAGLWWFQVLMEEIQTPNVAYSYFWGTHSPWNGEYDTDDDIGVLFRIDDNSPKTIAGVSKLVNENLCSNIIQSHSDNDRVLSFAYLDDKKSVGTVFILNKSGRNEDIRISFDNFKDKDVDITGLYSDSPYEKEFKNIIPQKNRIDNNKLELSVPSYSITIINF